MKLNQRFLCFLFLLFAVFCFAMPTRSYAVIDASSSLKMFAPYLGQYSNTWIYDSRELGGTITVTKAANNQRIEIAMQTATEGHNVEVKWLIDLETKSKKFSVKHITPTEPNGIGDYLAYFKGRDLLLEKTFHEKDGTWTVMRFHWRLMHVNNIQIVTEYQYSDGKKSASLVFNARRISS